MTRKQILDYQLKKSLTPDDYMKITEDDMSFVLAKSTQIVNGYVHYQSGSELDYVICDIAFDMLNDDLLRQINVKPMEVPTNVASIKEGDTIITFNQDSSSSSSSSKSAGSSSDYYIDTYRDELNRYRKLKSGGRC